MLSAIIRGRATSCCSLAIQTSTARGPRNAASDWVGSCATTIKRQRDRTPKVQSRTLTPPLRSGDPRKPLCYSFSQLRPFGKLATSYQLQVLPPFQFFDHTAPSSTTRDSVATV